MTLAPEVSKFAQAENTDSKHYLNTKWVLWFLKGDRTRSWEECLKRVAVLETVEDFWGLYNNIQPASGLTWGSDFYLFREGIKPMWEDPDNVKGGRWLMVVERTKRAERLDVCWLELMLALLGEQFDDYGAEICGAAVNVRQKGDKVALWTRDSSKDDVNISIGRIMREKLLMSENEQIKYEVHKDASARSCSVIKPKLILPPQVQKTTKTTSNANPQSAVPQ